jgi:hypothetical protein
MACNAADIPFLQFPRNEIIEVSILNRRLCSTILKGRCRSSLQVTRMKRGESLFPTCPRIPYRIPRKISKYRFLRADMLHQCQAVLELLRRGWEHPKADIGRPGSPKGSHSSMLKTSCDLIDLRRFPISSWIKHVLSTWSGTRSSRFCFCSVRVCKDYRGNILTQFLTSMKCGDEEYIVPRLYLVSLFPF